MPVTGPKGSLPLIAFLNANTIAGILDINLAEDLGSSETNKNLRNEMERVSILHRNLIKATLVYTEAEGSVCFWNKEDRSPAGLLDGRIRPLARFSLRYRLSSASSF